MLVTCSRYLSLWLTCQEHSVRARLTKGFNGSSFPLMSKVRFRRPGGAPKFIGADSCRIIGWDIGCGITGCFGNYSSWSIGCCITGCCNIGFCGYIGCAGTVKSFRKLCKLPMCSCTSPTASCEV